MLDAVDRVPHDRREDRLTEVFAYALRAVRTMSWTKARNENLVCAQVR